MRKSISKLCQQTIAQITVEWRLSFTRYKSDYIMRQLKDKFAMRRNFETKILFHMQTAKCVSINY